jgi:hypothetical protein
MRFGTRLRQLREAKKRFDPTAYTQNACGARMEPPITQSAWSQLEDDDSTPDYNTVLRASKALNLTKKETENFLKESGYDVRKQLRIEEVTEVVDGEERPATLSPEMEAKLRELAEEAKRFLRKVDELLPAL